MFIPPCIVLAPTSLPRTLVSAWPALAVWDSSVLCREGSWNVDTVTVCSVGKVGSQNVAFRLKLAGELVEVDGLVLRSSKETADRVKYQANAGSAIDRTRPFRLVPTFGCGFGL